MLASTGDSQVGGREIDAILADYFCKDFQARYKIDARSNPRAYLRLLSEVEKLKKQMSANSTKLPINIECFMEEKDVHGDLQRVDMESMCAHLFKRVESTLRQCLAQSSEWLFLSESCVGDSNGVYWLVWGFFLVAFEYCFADTFNTVRVIRGLTRFGRLFYWAYCKVVKKV